MTGSSCPPAGRGQCRQWLGVGGRPGRGPGLAHRPPGTGAEAALVPVGDEPRAVTSLTIAGSRMWTGTPRTAVTADGNTESNFSWSSRSMVTTSPRLDRNTAVRSGTLKVFSTERGVVSLPRLEDAGHGYLVTMTTFRKQLQVRPSRTSAAGPRHPAKALAANHSDQVTLIHLAATEADSKNRSGTARPRPVSTPPRRAGTPIMPQATVIARGRNGRHIMATPLSRPARPDRGGVRRHGRGDYRPARRGRHPGRPPVPRSRPGTGGLARTYLPRARQAGLR
jgi:hypothetical protein